MVCDDMSLERRPTGRSCIKMLSDFLQVARLKVFFLQMIAFTRLSSSERVVTMLETGEIERGDITQDRDIR